MAKYNDKSEIVEVYNKHMDHIKIDKNFINEIRIYRLGWASRKHNIDFLSSRLLGVHPARFTVKDEESYYTELMGIDARSFSRDLYKVEDIYRERKISSNPFYHTVVYMIYKIYRSNLGSKDKQTAIESISLIMLYKMMTSLIVGRFSKFNLDEKIAKAVLEGLSNRFLIKNVDSWNELLIHRSGDLQVDGLHEKRFMKLDAEGATRIISDVQTKLRSHVNEIYGATKVMIDAGGKIKDLSYLIENEDGEVRMKEIINTIDLKINIVMNNSSGVSSFINKDLVGVISTLNSTFKSKLFDEVLEGFVDVETKDKNEIISGVIIYSIKYLNSRDVPTNDLSEVLISISGYLSNPRLAPREMVVLKERVESMIKKIIGKDSKPLITSLSISFMIYLVVFSMIKI